MRLVGMVSGFVLVAAPVAAAAQGHAGMAGGHAGGHVSVIRTISYGPGFGPATNQVRGFGGHGFDHRGAGFHDRGRHDHDHDHDHGPWLGWGPSWGWGWSDCGAYGDACGWGHESGPGDASDDYGYTEGPPPNAACGAWLRHGDGYVWTRRVCGGDPPATPAPAAVAANECSDWVWRTDLHRSVCKRTTG